MQMKRTHKEKMQLRHKSMRGLQLLRVTWTDMDALGLKAGTPPRSLSTPATDGLRLRSPDPSTHIVGSCSHRGLSGPSSFSSQPNAQPAPRRKQKDP